MKETAIDEDYDKKKEIIRKYYGYNSGNSVGEWTRIIHCMEEYAKAKVKEAVPVVVQEVSESARFMVGDLGGYSELQINETSITIDKQSILSLEQSIIDKLVKEIKRHLPEAESSLAKKK